MIEIVVAAVAVAVVVVLLMAESGVVIEIVVGKGNEFAQPRKSSKCDGVWGLINPAYKNVTRSEGLRN